MAEGRMLKKQISESKKLAAAKSDSARLLYTWLIPWLDVEGRYMADPEIVKGHIFPKIRSWTVKKIDKLLNELNTLDLIILYEISGERYLQFTKFHEIQTIRRDREAESKIPPPKKGNRVDPGVLPDNSRLNKSKLSKDKLREAYSKYEIDKFKTLEEFFDFMFDEMWNIWPKDGRLNKERGREKFHARCREGLLGEIIAGANGYISYLAFQKNEKNFEQRAMYPSTFLEPKKARWKEYIGFKKPKKW